MNCSLCFQLAYCVVQFLEKDASLTEDVSIVIDVNIFNVCACMFKLSLVVMLLHVLVVVSTTFKCLV